MPVPTPHCLGLQPEPFIENDQQGRQEPWHPIHYHPAIGLRVGVMKNHPRKQRNDKSTHSDVKLQANDTIKCATITETTSITTAAPRPPVPELTLIALLLLHAATTAVAPTEKSAPGAPGAVLKQGLDSARNSKLSRSREPKKRNNR